MIPYPIGGSSNDSAVSFMGKNVDRWREGNEETGSLFGIKTSWAGASRKMKVQKPGETESIEFLAARLCINSFLTKCLQSMNFLPIRILF